MLAAFGAWAVVGQEEAPAPEVKNPPVVTQEGPTGDGRTGPPPGQIHPRV
jgi:hypothetical protein